MKVQKRLRLSRLILLLALLAAAGWILWWFCGRVPDLETYQSEIERAITEQEYEQAMDLCNQALKTYPEEGALYEQKAEIYYAQGETDLAVRTLDYGYKQTGLGSLLELRNTYDDTVEPDVVFQPAQVAAPDHTEESATEQENGGDGSGAQEEAPQEAGTEGEVEEVYLPYVLPQVSLPQVDPPEPSPEETPDEEVPDGGTPETESSDGGAESTGTPAENVQQDEPRQEDKIQTSNAQEG